MVLWVQVEQDCTTKFHRGKNCYINDERLVTKPAPKNLPQREGGSTKWERHSCYQDVYARSMLDGEAQDQRR